MKLHSIGEMILSGGTYTGRLVWHDVPHLRIRDGASPLAVMDGRGRIIGRMWQTGLPWEGDATGDVFELAIRRAAGAVACLRATPVLNGPHDVWALWDLSSAPQLWTVPLGRMIAALEELEAA